MAYFRSTFHARAAAITADVVNSNDNNNNVNTATISTQPNLWRTLQILKVDLNILN